MVTGVSLHAFIISVPAGTSDSRAVYCRVAYLRQCSPPFRPSHDGSKIDVRLCSVLRLNAAENESNRSDNTAARLGTHGSSSIASTTRNKVTHTATAKRICRFMNGAL